MAIVNRRNAVIGWFALRVGKKVARKKAKRVGGRLTNWRSDNKNHKNGKKSA